MASRAAPALLAVVAAFVVLWAVTHLTAAGQEADAGFFRTVAPLHDAVGGVAGLARRALPVVCAAVVTVLVVMAVARRAWRELGAAALVTALGTGIALVLRSLLVRPNLGDYGYAEQTFPSGNVAAVAGLCAAAWLLWPWATRRRAAWAGLAVSVVAAAASVVTYAHRPSDVVGSLLLVATVTLAVSWLLGVPRRPRETQAAFATFSRASRRRAPRSGRRRAPR